MAHLEDTHASRVARSIALAAGLLLFYFWGFIPYRIGLRASYWSPAVLREWRRAGWWVVAVFCVNIFGIALEVVLARFQHS